MARIVAVDFGEKRIGLATCDATGTVVAGRATLLRRSDARAIAEIVQFCKDEEIEAIVIGIPRSPEGVESPLAARIRTFALKLARETGLTVAEHEETLTSWEAQHAAPLLTKEEVDRAAAAILLTDYLAHASGKPS
jgi:putative Holliday junction resolvase